MNMFVRCFLIAIVWVAPVSIFIFFNGEIIITPTLDMGVFLLSAFLTDKILKYKNKIIDNKREEINLSIFINDIYRFIKINKKTILKYISIFAFTQIIFSLFIFVKNKLQISNEIILNILATIIGLITLFVVIAIWHIDDKDKKTDNNRETE